MTEQEIQKLKSEAYDLIVEYELKFNDLENVKKRLELANGKVKAALEEPKPANE